MINSILRAPLSLVILLHVNGIASAAVPSAPQNLTPSWLLNYSPSGTQSLLWWEPVTGATSYSLYQYDESSSAWVLAIGGLTEPLYRNFLPPPPPTRYVVTASNADGESGPSNEALVEENYFNFMITGDWPEYSSWSDSVTPTNAWLSWAVSHVSGADGLVELGTNGTDFTTVMLNTNYQGWHNVLLTNLNPRSYYYYRITSVGTNRGGLTMTRWFATDDTNHPPVAYAVQAWTYQGTPTEVVLSGNDSAGTPPYVSIQNFRIIEGPTNGTLSATSIGAWLDTGSVTYTPFANTRFTDHFWYVANDGELDSAPALVTITNYFINSYPEAGFATYSTLEGVPVAIEFAASDPDGDPVTIEVDTYSPPIGAISGPLTNLIYTPAPGFIGTDVVFYHVSDGEFSTMGIIEIEVISTNLPPIAISQSATVAEEGSTNIVLSGTDPNNDSLIYLLTSYPVHGDLIGTPPNLIYRPFANVNGADEFTFMVFDARMESSSAVVSLTVTPVNDAPVVSDQTTTIDEDSQLNLNILTAFDWEDDAVTYAIVTEPQHGQIVDGIYHPDSNYAGSDTLTFVANDGQEGSAPATLSITILNVNDAPTLDSILNHATAEDGPAITRTLTGISAGPGNEIESVTITAVSSNPALIPNPSVSYSSPDTSGTITFQSLPNVSGDAAITVTVSDGSLAIQRTFNVQISPLNDPPAIDPAATVHILEDAGPQVISLAGISGGPADEPQAVAITIASTFEAVTGVPSLSYTSPNSTGTITFTPPANAHGMAVINVTVDDGLASTVRPVQILIDPANDAPVANAQSVTTPYNSATSITLAGSDVDGNTLTYTVLSSPANGVLSGTAPSLTFTPNLNWSGTTSFTFRVSDGSLNSTVATVSITVNPPASVPPAPSALTATAISRTRIDLAWTDNATTETGFKIERSANGTSWSQIATVGPNIRNFSSTGLSANKLYYYRVRAYNALGNSPYSNTASARTLR